MKWIEWVEPYDESNDPVYLRIAATTAIAAMKRMHPYASDQDALEEFIVVNWATEVDIP
jgi:hypothetical protein